MGPKARTVCGASRSVIHSVCYRPGGEPGGCTCFMRRQSLFRHCADLSLEHQENYLSKHVLEQKVVVATAQIRRRKRMSEAQKKIVENTLKVLNQHRQQLIQAEKMASLGNSPPELPTRSRTPELCKPIFLISIKTLSTNR